MIIANEKTLNFALVFLLILSGIFGGALLAGLLFFLQEVNWLLDVINGGLK